MKGYSFRAYAATEASDEGGCLRIYQHGKLIYQRASDDMFVVYLGQLAIPDLRVPAIPDGTDLTGNGRADMIVTSWSGGAHCCFTHYLFELEPTLRLITTIKDRDADMAHFEDIYHNHRYSYVTADIWSYWPASFASSVSHTLILKWKQGGLVPDLERMARPAPTPEEWDKALSAANAATGDRDALGVTLWDTVLDLIYTGHSDLAWKFVQQVNPSALRGDNPSLEQFCSKLAASPVWPTLKPTVKNIPPRCAFALAAGKAHSTHR